MINGHNSLCSILILQDIDGADEDTTAIAPSTCLKRIDVYEFLNSSTWTQRVIIFIIMVDIEAYLAAQAEDVSVDLLVHRHTRTPTVPLNIP